MLCNDCSIRVHYNVVTDDHHMLVELACGAALAAGYGDSLQGLVDNGELSSLHNVVLVVCGGSAVNVDTLIQWKNTYSL